LDSKSLDALSCKGWNISQKSSIPTLGKGNDIKPVPFYVAIAYWRYWDKQSDPLAGAIIEALATGHLLMLVDDAFGVERTAEERHQALFDFLHPDSADKAA